MNKLKSGQLHLKGDPTYPTYWWNYLGSCRLGTESIEIILKNEYNATVKKLASFDWIITFPSDAEMLLFIMKWS